MTTNEIVTMIKESGIVFDKVEIEAADIPFGIGSGGGVILDVSGGVTAVVVLGGRIDGKTKFIQ